MIESKKIKNPFPGLRPFETDEYRLFFGREGQSDALIARLQRSHFLAVVGTSGSGKSSLVRAGLLPALRGGLMAGAGSGWRIAIMRPGSDPIGNLALALADKDVLLEAGGGLPPAEAEAVIEATLRRGALGLVDVARQARLAEHEKLLVVVDQFEELFRFRAARESSSTGDDASAFVKLLIEAAQQHEFSIYVVPTMRSDFLGDCAQFQGLPEAINDGQYLIPRMTRDERRFAITGPVGVTRGKITEPLVNRLMNDVGDNPDQLPILQHALMRTWDHWAWQRKNGEPIGLEHYEAVGTMSDALSEHADEAFNELPDERSRLIAEVLFKALTERGADNREIRRPTCLKDICDIANAGAQEVSAVVEVFRRGGRSFLMPPVGVALEPETVIDISHESLIRNWRRLKEWVKDEAESARIYRRLAGAATDYRAGAGGLLDDVTLQYVLRWKEKSKPDHAWGARYHPAFDDAMAYLEESRAARDARIAAEGERERRELETARAFAEKQARSAQRMRRLTGALCIILLFALGTAAYALHQRSDAKRAENHAKVAQVAAQKSELGAINAQLAAQKSERDAKVLATRLQDEKTQTEALAADLKKKSEEAENALAAESKALDAQELETKRASEQTRKAEIARQQAVDSEAQVKAAVKRAELIRHGVEAYRREQFQEALAHYEILRKSLVELQTLKPAQATQYAPDLGWTHSNIGTTHLRASDHNSAIEAYDKALAVFKQFPESANDPILLETYEGLAEAYHFVAVNGRPKPGMVVPDKSKSSEDFSNAESFFKLAVTFQEKQVPQKASEVAKAYSKFARLYVDNGKFVEAEANFKSAVAVWRQASAAGPLGNNERAALAATLAELGEFYQGQEARYDDSVRVFNEMIVVQEDFEIQYFAQHGQEIANSYSDLGQIYASKGNTEKAEDAFRTANLLQRTALKFRQLEKSASTQAQPTLVRGLTADLDELGDAYVKLGKFSDAEAIYVTASELRKHDSNELWKSYDKLAKFYRINKKDYAESERYNKLLVEYYQGKSDSPEYAAALMQLGALYAEDPNRAADAESYYRSALKIYAARNDWWNQDLILYRLAKLYEKQGRVPEREQALRDRVDVLTKYFNQITTPSAPRPKDSITLVSEYLYAISALAGFYKGKDNAKAEAAYDQALAAHDYVTRTIYNEKILKFYGATLDEHQKLLKDLNREGDAVAVANKNQVVKEKLRQFGQYREQSVQQTLGPAQATAQ